MSAEWPGVVRWGDDLSDHPLVAALRARPNIWAVVWDGPSPEGDVFIRLREVAQWHPRIEHKSNFLDPARTAGEPLQMLARWVGCPGCDR